MNLIGISQRLIPCIGLSNTWEFLDIKTKGEMFIIEKNSFLLMGFFGIKNDETSGKCKNLRGLDEGFG